ncbi:MAG: YibE/F family protein [Spirochaetes bacterium]|nr:YibE/F family protein [Spirochaetota bacterium]
MDRKIIIFGFFLSFGLFSADLSAEFAKCRILKKQILDVKRQKELDRVEKLQARVLSGQYKNKLATVYNYLWAKTRQGYNIEAEEGDVVIARLNQAGKDLQGNVAFYHRSDKLILLFLVFFSIVILIARGKGVRSVISLILVYGSIIFVFLPLLQKGYSPVMLAALVAFFSTLMTFILILKNRIKVLAATIGSLAGLFTAIIISLIAFSMANITGFTTTEGRALVMFAENLDNFNLYNLKGIFIAGIVITCMGSVMDIASGVASSLLELHRTDPGLGFGKLFRHGLSVGKDVTGTMVNTLIFVSMTNLVVYFMVFRIMKTPFLRFSGFKFIIILMLYGLISSISLVLTVPLTVLTGAAILKIRSFKYLKMSVIAVTFLVSFTMAHHVLAWIEPPDIEFYLHPLTRIYHNRDKDEYALANVIRGKTQDKTGISVKISGGTFKGRTIQTRYSGGKDGSIKPGSRVLLWLERSEREIKSSLIIDQYKFYIIYYLIGLFILLLCLVNGKTGIKVSVSLILAVYAILSIYTYCIVKGVPVFISTIIVASVTLCGIVLAVSKNKSMFKITFLSSLIGVILTFIFALIIGKALHINGLSMESFQLLNYYNAHYNQGAIKNIYAVVYSIVVLGALGAIIDVAITIGSALNEIKLVKPAIRLKELFRHGMEIGKDLAGTMINTLLLAYTGLNLALILMWSVTSTEWLQFFNLEFISVEITKALAGSLGFLLIIPVTSFIGGLVLIKKNS